MSQTKTAGPDYALGFSEWGNRTHKRLTAEVNARHLMPYLKPGHIVLDFGCGPGAMTMGLAEAVEPYGEAHGVGIIGEWIQEARESAAEGGRDNATFHHVDYLESLPFEDNTFDVAHCHNILMTLPDPLVALDELNRLLKPGGIISCREVLLDASFSFPDRDGILTRFWEMFTDFLALEFRFAPLGKQLGELLTQKGFEKAEMSANFDIYSEPEDMEFIYDVFLSWFLSDETMDTAIARGAATEELRDRIRDYYYNEWRYDPAAIAAVAYGIAIAYKPMPA